MTPEDYIKERLDDQIEWYDRKSVWNKKGFITLQIITLVASAAVPVFAIYSSVMWARLLIAILGSATAICTGIVSLFQFREHWIEYRTTSESLKHEKYLYQTKTDPYTDDDSFVTLVKRVEALATQENTAWQERLITHKTDDKEIQKETS